jgi:hypothetical protein
VFVVLCSEEQVGDYALDRHYDSEMHSSGAAAIAYLTMTRQREHWKNRARPRMAIPS